MGSTPYTQSQQNMMNIMGGARPSENSQMVWQGMEGYLPINSQQPSIQSMFPVNSYGVPNIGTSGIQNAGVGNMTSAFGTPGTWGGGYGGGYGGQGGGYGEGVAGGAGLTGSAFGGEGPGIAGGGLVGPAQGSHASIAGILGALAHAITGDILGTGKGLISTAMNEARGINSVTNPTPISMIDNFIGNAIFGYDINDAKAEFEGLASNPGLSSGGNSIGDLGASLGPEGPGFGLGFGTGPGVGEGGGGGFGK